MLHPLKLWNIKNDQTVIFMDAFFLKDENLLKIGDKILSNERLNANDGIALYQSKDIIGVGSLADFVRGQRHGKTAFYVYNQHINYTNICVNKCRFCAFSRDAEETGSYTMTIDDVRRKLLERKDEPITEIHMVGGINPSLPFEYYIELLRCIKNIRPYATIKAFTAVEIHHLSKISGMSIQNTVEILKQAGLDMMPGGGAEILEDRVRSLLFPKKIDSSRWLSIMRQAHQTGLTSNATMLYGHVETIEERVHHLLQLRSLQDETHGFSAFIPLAFHSKNTSLSDIPATTGFDDLKNIAIARLLLDNFDHIKAYWVMIGEKLAQIALSFGADDLDGTIIEEKISHMAGATSSKGLSSLQIEDMILGAGYVPVQRDSFYNPVNKKI
jgi:aminodeoxyfutalosine synthase